MSDSSSAHEAIQLPLVTGHVVNAFFGLVYHSALICPLPARLSFRARPTGQLATTLLSR